MRVGPASKRHRSTRLTRATLTDREHFREILSPARGEMPRKFDEGDSHALGRRRSGPRERPIRLQYGFFFSARLSFFRKTPASHPTSRPGTVAGAGRRRRSASRDRNMSGRWDDRGGGRDRGGNDRGGGGDRRGGGGYGGGYGGGFSDAAAAAATVAASAETAAGFATTAAAAATVAASTTAATTGAAAATTTATATAAAAAAAGRARWRPLRWAATSRRSRSRSASSSR